MSANWEDTTDMISDYYCHVLKLVPLLASIKVLIMLLVVLKLWHDIFIKKTSRLKMSSNIVNGSKSVDSN